MRASVIVEEVLESSLEQPITDNPTQDATNKTRNLLFNVLTLTSISNYTANSLFVKNALNTTDASRFFYFERIIRLVSSNMNFPPHSGDSFGCRIRNRTEKFLSFCFSQGS